ncbi:hypothetical protein PENTCL1PPCAC_13493, partial [Pristionchus entomophagus]
SHFLQNIPKLWDDIVVELEVEAERQRPYDVSDGYNDAVSDVDCLVAALSQPIDDLQRVVVDRVLECSRSEPDLVE